MSIEPRLFFGKYRGTVEDNNDQLHLGRIRAKVPAVLGDKLTGWATPCIPYAGNSEGFFFIPPKHANVWIEFEEGKQELPIWSGCFWGTGEAPGFPAQPDTKIIKTKTATITLDDSPGTGGITIETTSGVKITMNSSGIELQNGSAKITITPSEVSINDGALKVV